MFGVVPACAGARGRTCPTDGGNGACLAIFTGRRACASAIRIADIIGLRGILCDVIASLFGRVDGDRIQLIRLLGVDLLDRALFRAADQHSDAGDGRGAQPGSHFIPLMNGRFPNARAIIWCAI